MRRSPAILPAALVAAASVAVVCLCLETRPCEDRCDGGQEVLRRTWASSRRELLQEGSVQNVESFSPDEALLQASRSGDTEAILRLLKQDANLEARNAYGATPLILAALSGQDDVVKILVNAGANKDAKSDRGFTPLTESSIFGHVMVVKFLVQEGADVNGYDNQGFTALHVAAQTGNWEIVVVLLNNGADIESKTFVSRATPLILASEAGRLGVVNELIARGANVNATKNTGTTALHLAATRRDSSQLLVSLVRAGADVNGRTILGKTPLRFAARFGNLEGVKFLLKNNAERNIADIFDMLPIDDICGCIANSRDNSSLHCPNGTCISSTESDQIRMQLFSYENIDDLVFPSNVEPAFEEVALDQFSG